MLLSMNWLREFVPYNGTAQELGDRLTMLGLELEDITRPFAALDDFIIGHVLTCDVHPESDHLHICTVNVGTEEVLTIVCGAPNVAAGQKVVVATVGCTMPDGMKIKKAKLRGVPSFGMICSERELGLSDDHDGIMVLDENAPVGTRVVEYLNLDDTVLDLSVTPNRADCLSVLGIARETAMAFNLPLTMPALKAAADIEKGDDASNVMDIVIPDANQCPVFNGRVLENVRVGKSPAWVRYRLMSVGLRPISTIVDATNYVMMELGQPLHAYDLDTLKSGKIVVECAAEGQKFTTLDEQERTLKASDLLIKDGETAIGLAGVMGGLDTEITDSCTRVFLESAIFRPASIRRTARRLGLPSDASFRFERGVDQGLCEFCMNRAAQLMVELSGATLRPGTCTTEAKALQAKVLRFRPARAAALLGVELSDEFCRNALLGLQCTLEENKDADGNADWLVTAPSFRHDLDREADLIEEVARIYGMDNIEPVLPRISKPLGEGKRESEYDFWSRIKHWGRGLGMHEAVNYSFVGQKDLDVLNMPTDGRIAVMNPLSSEQDVLRTTLTPGLLNNLRQNLGQGNNSLRLFELAHIFSADKDSDTTASEHGRLAVMLYGTRNAGGYPHAENDMDYLDVKAVAEHFARAFNLPALNFTRMDAHNFLSPAVEVTAGGKHLGVIGRVKPEIADAYNARKDVWMTELDLDAAMQLNRDAGVRQFVALPVFPAVRRDITVMAPQTMPVSAVLDAVSSMKLKLFKEMQLIDVFCPEAAEGEETKRHLTFRLTFRADRTLKDTEVDKERDIVAKSLVEHLGVRI